MNLKTHRKTNRVPSAARRQPSGLGPLRLGLCCQFAAQPISFRTATATRLLQMKPARRHDILSQLCLSNAHALRAALQYCAAHHIGCFRINSQILPLKTHPLAGYAIGDLPRSAAIEDAFRRCGRFARAHHIRTTFHPDQFIVLNSPRNDVVDRSIEELEYQAEVSDWVGADVINIHAGGCYGDKSAALARLAAHLDRLSDSARSKLTIENDDTIYTPSDLLPLCRSTGLPLVYDVHHHRCLPDDLSVERATEEALRTWNREPVFHLSSPLDGWNGLYPERHHDYIDLADFPACWRRLAVTVEVEAKAKELAVARLRRGLCAIRSSGRGPVARSKRHRRHASQPDSPARAPGPGGRHAS